MSAVVTGLGAALALASPAAAIPVCDQPEPPPACDPQPQPKAAVLSVDGVQQTPTRDGVHIWGWALDADAKTTALTVRFSVDGVAAGSTTARISRPDVAASHPGFGPLHGYDVTLPASAARHNVCVTAVSVGGGANASSCRQMDDITGFEATALSYDTGRAVLTNTSLDQLDKVTNRNNTAVQQSTEISGTRTVTAAQGWSQTTGLKVSVSTSFKTGIPILAEGKISVTVEGSYSYTDNGSVSRAQTFAWRQPVLVPARSIVEATVTVLHSTISVPYTMTGNVVYRSGARAAGTLSGTFTGGNSENLAVSLTQYNLDGTPAAAPARQPAAAALEATVTR